MYLLLFFFEKPRWVSKKHDRFFYISQMLRHMQCAFCHSKFAITDMRKSSLSFLNRESRWQQFPLLFFNVNTLFSSARITTAIKIRNDLSGSGEIYATLKCNISLEIIHCSDENRECPIICIYTVWYARLADRSDCQDKKVVRMKSHSRIIFSISPRMSKRSVKCESMYEIDLEKT